MFHRGTVISENGLNESYFLSRGLSVWSLHVLPVLAWVSSRSKDMHVRLSGGAKLPVGVIVKAHGCLFTRDPAMDW